MRRCVADVIEFQPLRERTNEPPTRGRSANFQALFFGLLGNFTRFHYFSLFFSLSLSLSLFSREQLKFIELLRANRSNAALLLATRSVCCWTFGDDFFFSSICSRTLEYNNCRVLLVKFYFAKKKKKEKNTG